MDELTKNGARPHDGRPGSLGELIHAAVRRTIEVAVDEELSAALGARPYERGGQRRGYRNGTKSRTVTGPTGPLALRVPRASLFTATGGQEWTSRLAPCAARVSAIPLPLAEWHTVYHSVTGLGVPRNHDSARWRSDTRKPVLLTKVSWVARRGSTTVPMVTWTTSPFWFSVVVRTLINSWLTAKVATAAPGRLPPSAPPRNRLGDFAPPRGACHRGRRPDGGAGGLVGVGAAANSRRLRRMPFTAGFRRHRGPAPPSWRCPDSCADHPGHEPGRPWPPPASADQVNLGRSRRADPAPHALDEGGDASRGRLARRTDE